jgi:acyl carrier protein
MGIEEEFDIEIPDEDAGNSPMSAKQWITSRQTGC